MLELIFEVVEFEVEPVLLGRVIGAGGGGGGGGGGGAQPTAGGASGGGRIAGGASGGGTNGGCTNGGCSLFIFTPSTHTLHQKINFAIINVTTCFATLIFILMQLSYFMFIRKD